MCLWLFLSCLLLLARSDACVRTKDADYGGMPEVRLRCPNDMVRVADSRSTRALVEWDESDFHIRSTNTIKSVYQTVPERGLSTTVRRRFEEGHHLVEYKAVDETGIIDTCNFHVTVKVVRCPELYNPQYGTLTCQAQNLLHSQCGITCSPGYSLYGQRNIRCRSNGQWSHDVPYCRVTTCPDPGTPLHGHRTCDTPTHRFGSSCAFRCDRGYVIRGSSTLLCLVNGSVPGWYGVPPYCSEMRSPRVGVCPTDIELSSGQPYMRVRKPEVRFFTALEREAPHTCTHFNDRGYHNFSIGLHHITCSAWDPVYGEESSVQCQFTIKVKANPCRALPEPVNGFLMCSRVFGGSSTQETSCQLYCNRGYVPARTPFYHNSVFVCDHTGAWQPSRFVPSCVRPKRPRELRLPAEVFYTSHNCSNLTNLDEVRNKFERHLWSLVRQEATCLMSPGDCLLENVEVQCRPDVGPIRRRLSSRHRRRMVLGERSDQTISSRHPRSSRSHRGTSDSRRGMSDRYPRTNRRARGARRRLRDSPSRSRSDLSEQGDSAVTHEPSGTPTQFLMPVLFYLSTRLPPTGGQWPDEYHKACKRLFGMFDLFEHKLWDGTFSIEDEVTSLQIEEVSNSLTHDEKKAVCDIGHLFYNSELLCVPCGPGTFYQVAEDRCTPCGVGSYQNGTNTHECKSCPAGTTTRDEGATNVTQCVDVDECESNPCLHDGVCENTVGSFSCQCQAGYTGRHCNLQIYDCSSHLCLNGGTCIPAGRSNHSCSCRPGYSGYYCQFPSIDGNWGDWSAWSACSKSCEMGQRFRTRTCDRPEPSHGGQSCHGASREETVCNIHPCPSCKRLRRPYQGEIECKRDEDMDLQICQVSCLPGFNFTAPVYDFYICGRNTSYLWPHDTHDSPRYVLPGCAELSEADQVNFQLRASMPVHCTTSNQRYIRRQVRRRARQLTAHLACIREGRCQLQPPTISGCTSRRRRSLQEESLNIGITVTYNTSRKNTVTSLFSESKTSSELTALGQYLMEDSHKRMLYIDLNGQRIFVKSTTAKTEALCQPGSVSAKDNLHCVECPPGSYHQPERDTCHLCEEGTYQPKSGQSSCLHCPHSRKTYGRGAMFPIECYDDSDGAIPPVIPDNYVDEGAVPTAVISAALVCLQSLALVGMLVFLWQRYRRRQRSGTGETMDQGKTSTEDIVLSAADMSPSCKDTSVFPSQTET